MKRCICIALSLVLTLFLGGISASAEYTGEQSVIIEYSVENTAVQEKIIERNFHSVEKVEKIDENSLAVFVSDGTDMNSVTEALCEEEEVVLAEENFERQLHFTPNDPYFANYQWGLKNAHFPDAWDFSEYGGEEITVAVVDSGVNSHADLSSHLLAGYNVVSGNTDITDYMNHGTIVAGVIGAVTNNGSNLAGAAGPFNIKILPIKVYNDAENTIYLSDLLKGVEYAANNGADVINLSLGGTNYSATEEAKYNEIIEGGIPIIASSGNDALKGNPVMYPASYDKVISVGSHGQTGTVSSFSCYNDKVDITAPGEFICMYSSAYISSTGTFDAGVYAAEGTSFAAPHVSATAAILKSIVPDLDGTDVHDIIVGTAVLPSTQTGYTSYYGWGYLDAYAAVSKLFEVTGADVSGGVLMGEFNTDKKEYTINTTLGTKEVTPLCYASLSAFDISKNGNIHSISFTNPKGETSEYTFEYKTLESGTILPCIYESGNKIVFEAASYEKNSKALDFYIVAAEIEGDMLKNCNYLPVTTNGKYDAYNITLDKNDNAVYKLFLWDGFDNIKPIKDLDIHNN